MDPQTSKEFKIFADEILAEIGDRNPMSAAEVAYLQAYDKWIKRVPFVVGMPNAEEILQKFNAEKPRRKRGFNGHRSISVNYKIIEDALYTVMFEYCMRNPSLRAKIKRALLERINPKPPPISKPRLKFPSTKFRTASHN